MGKYEITDKAREYYADALDFMRKQRLAKDEGETFFLLKELNLLRNQFKEVKYPALVARELFPVASGMGSGLDSISYGVYNMSGKAQVIEGSADLPKVNAKTKEVTEKVRPLGIAYSITKLEMERALRAGRSLDQRMLMALIRGMEQKLDDIAFFGDEEYGLNGLFLDPSKLQVETIVADGSGSSKKWSTKTFDKIERDIIQMVSALPDEFIGENLVLALTPDNYQRLQTLRIANTSDSLMSYIMAKTDIKRVVKTKKLKTVSTMSSKDVAVLMPDTAEICELVIPRDREVQAPFQDGRELVTDVYLDVSGLHLYHPKAIITTDEV
jgi:hypothetical protein